MPSINFPSTASSASAPIAIAKRSHFAERPSLMNAFRGFSHASLGPPSETNTTVGRYAREGTTSLSSIIALAICNAVPTVPLLHSEIPGKTKSGRDLRRITTRSFSSCSTSTTTRLSRFHIWQRSRRGCGIICKAKGSEVAMAQVSIGQVENLEDLVRELQSVREALGMV